MVRIVFDCNQRLFAIIPLIRKYLKYKLVDELTDEEIALKLGVSRRALYGIKPNAYFRIAIWSHQVAYIKENTYEFIFNYAGLYERLK